MVAGGVLLFASLLYLALLFAVAWWGDRRGVYPADSAWRPRVYALTLAVYCSSWTFYGAVGSAAQSTWSYLPIYLGPLLLLAFAPGVMRRLIELARRRAVTSIADLIGTRFGKSSGLAALVTLIALVAAVPYIALQLRAVAMSYEVLSGGAGGVDSALWVALILALFAILFGTRNIDAREHHHGLMLAVAVESLVKLVAFVVIAGFALGQLGEVPDALGARLRELPSAGLPEGFIAATGLSMLAMFCLPRQFQVAVVECADSADFERARRGFGLYLVIISLCVLPIVWAGQQAFGADAGQAERWVLQLPLREGHNGLALLAYLGGFSAATGMVIVASVALATMISNHLVLPLLLRAGGLPSAGSLTAPVLWIRRLSILALVLLGYAYHRGTTGDQALAAIGLLAFAAVAQFAPAILAGLYWGGVSRRGAAAGLSVGIALWSYTLLLPQLLPGDWLQQGPLGIAWLRPTGLFGISGWDALTHGALCSLFGNISALILVSLRQRPRLDERLHAAAFLGDDDAARDRQWPGEVSLAELRAVTERILGARAAERAFADYAAQRGAAMPSQVDRGLLLHIERQLAGAIGASSARRVLATALSGRGLDPAEVVSLLDETSQQLRFNRELLAATLDNIAQGISVVDAEMRLVAWNRRYLELFDYPSGMVYIGRPVADLIRWNAERGECGPGEVETHVGKRMEHMRQGSAHVYQRVRADGRVIEMRGQPMPGGGFATTFTDITEFKRSEQALIDAKAGLEQRVDERTLALREALQAQEAAKQEAEAANRSKSRFLAAASHDLVQPLNAARLFAAALPELGDDPLEVRAVGERIDLALHSAEELLGGLLEISRLDSGTLTPERSVFDAAELCRSLQLQFAAQAAARELELRLHGRAQGVNSDRVMLRRILQNFLSNALRYTRHGGVLLATRRRGDRLRFEVWDTGPGIAEEQRQRVFEEFARLDAGSPWGEHGLGLGLSICERSAALLGHPLQLHSRLGRGSVFAIEVPCAELPAVLAGPARVALPASAAAGLAVLCIDDQPDNVAALNILLQRWGLRVDSATTLEAALARIDAQPPDLLLVDYHLGDGLDGIAVIAILRQRIGRAVPAALVSAERDEAVLARARELGLPVLPKPVAPAALRALVDALAARRHSSG